MLKRKAKRIGKKAFKFKFTVVVHNADIHHTEKWCAARPKMSESL